MSDVLNKLDNEKGQIIALLIIIVFIFFFKWFFWIVFDFWTSNLLDLSIFWTSYFQDNKIIIWDILNIILWFIYLFLLNWLFSMEIKEEKKEDKWPNKKQIFYSFWYIIKILFNIFIIIVALLSIMYIIWINSKSFEQIDLLKIKTYKNLIDFFITNMIIWWAILNIYNITFTDILIKNPKINYKTLDKEYINQWIRNIVVTSFFLTIFMIFSKFVYWFLSTIIN